jgi:Flp pilus assembly protein TadG
MADGCHSVFGHSAGQSCAELAFSVPLLMVLFLIIIETGRVCLIALSLSSAARAGVQYGAQNLTTVGDNTGMQNAAKADAATLAGFVATSTHYCRCSDGSSSTCLSTDCSTSHRLTYVKVNTSATYTPWISWPGVPVAVTMTGQAIMRVAAQ